MNKKENKKGCHPEKSLFRISSFLINNKKARDPRALRTATSGMTASFGFTLIELLVVVLIIGILTSVALPQYRKAVERARATEAVSNMTVLMSAVDRFILANGYVNKSGDDFKKALDVEMPKTKDGSKGINYYVSCGTRDCRINAQPRDRKYLLQVVKYKSSNSQGWKNKYCWYQSNAGKGVCDWLAGEGWKVGETGSWVGD